MVEKKERKKTAKNKPLTGEDCILSVVVMKLEAISKIGFWLNIKAGPSSIPQKY